ELILKVTIDKKNTSLTIVATKSFEVTNAGAKNIRNAERD
ncbi:hypothetical protein EZS27_036044, partial [termite gut metagenome]